VYSIFNGDQTTGTLLASNTLNITNTKKTGTDTEYGSFDVYKMDGRSMITGYSATFTVYSDAACSTVVGTFSTDTATGIASVTGLGAGPYYMKETASPTGYQSNDTVWVIGMDSDVDTALDGDVFVTTTTYSVLSVKVFSDGEPTGDNLLGDGILSVNNTPNTSTDSVPASIAIYKTDGSSALAGVVFTLAGIGTETTDASGIASFTGLAAVGTYELTESGPLTGYTGSSATWYVKVTSSENSAWNDGHTSYVTTTTYSAAIYTDSDCTTLATLNNSNQLEVANTRNSYTVTVTKSFSGVDALPADFAINYGTSGSLTLGDASYNSETKTYTWTVSLAKLFHIFSNNFFKCVFWHLLNFYQNFIQIQSICKSETSF